MVAITCGHIIYFANSLNQLEDGRVSGKKSVTAAKIISLICVISGKQWQIARPVVWNKCAASWGDMP